MAPTGRVTTGELAAGVHAAGVAGQAVCLHTSLKSFGQVEGGAATVLTAFLDAGCTVLAPTFSYGFSLRSQPGMRPARNGYDYEAAYDQPTAPPASARVYTAASNEVARDMGSLPAALLAMPGRVRGNHPICSFAAVGPQAQRLVGRQHPLDVMAPLAQLAADGGTVLLLGVSLTTLTLLHLAERLAGRTLFRRWAAGPDGRPMLVEVGGCSDGFERLRPALAGRLRTLSVGPSTWTVVPAQPALAAAVTAIRAHPAITHCSDPACERCRDAIAGGPLT